MTCVFSCSLTAEWEQLAQPLLANVQRTPQQRGDVDREERVAEQRSADAQLTGHRAAEVSCQEQRAQDRRPRHEVEHDACELDDANPENRLGRVTELGGSLHCRREYEHL